MKYQFNFRWRTPPHAAFITYSVAIPTSLYFKLNTPGNVIHHLIKKFALIELNKDKLDNKFLKFSIDFDNSDEDTTMKNETLESFLKKFQCLSEASKQTLQTLYISSSLQNAFKTEEKLANWLKMIKEDTNCDNDRFDSPTLFLGILDSSLNQLIDHFSDPKFDNPEKVSLYKEILEIVNDRVERYKKDEELNDFIDFINPYSTSIVVNFSTFISSSDKVEVEGNKNIASLHTTMVGEESRFKIARILKNSFDYVSFTTIENAFITQMIDFLEAC